MLIDEEALIEIQKFSMSGPIFLSFPIVHVDIRSMYSLGIHFVQYSGLIPF